jgi:hypothetical protein
MAFDDWTAAGPTRETNCSDVPVCRPFVMQEDADLITPLPPAPFPELKPLTWIARLGTPGFRPDIPWAFIVSLVLTLGAILGAFSGAR